ncbi:SAM-dependent methyltransferase [Yimella sp. cx-573]|nr:SAM-dependent methyltransferase [Yimella sp. cx-573]
MSEYLVLLAASANRVYADAAPRLARAEAQAVLAGTGGPVQVGVEQLAGVDYLHVTTESPAAIAALSNLSATFAIFQPEGELLRPIPLQRRQLYPSDLVTIQKYQGKTNEQWTRLLLNVTATATKRPERWLNGELDVMDPMCGRGTTLNIALLAGYDTIGVDLDRKDYDTYAAFLKTWVQTHRLKHAMDRGASTTGGRARGREFTLEVAPTKEAFKAGETQRVRYLNTDTCDLDGLVRAASVDVIVTDTPYGVQHGSHGDRLSRRPLELIDRALPSWMRTLRTGGAIGLSYNRHVASTDDLALVLQQHGLTVQDGLLSSFRHRVDASIDRDLIVAVKG